MDETSYSDTITLNLTIGELWTLYFDAGHEAFRGPWPVPEGVPTHAFRESYQRKVTDAVMALEEPVAVSGSENT